MTGDTRTIVLLSGQKESFLAYVTGIVESEFRSQGMRHLTAIAAMLTLSGLQAVMAASTDHCGCHPTPNCAAPLTPVPCDECSGSQTTSGCTSCNSCGTGIVEGCSQCSAALCGCGVCGTCGVMAGCSVCGQDTCCWDCTYEEGTDIESLTPESQSKMLYEQSQARLHFEVPESAGVWLSDQRMSTPGEKRVFIIPIADRTKQYKYVVKVDVVIRGKKYFRKIALNSVTAGTILNLKVAVPELAEDATPAIDHEVSTVAPGGAPKADG